MWAVVRDGDTGNLSTIKCRCCSNSAAASETGLNTHQPSRVPEAAALAGKSGGLGDLEITEVSVLRRGFIRPEHEHRAALLGAVRAMHLAGLNVK